MAKKTDKKPKVVKKKDESLTMVNVPLSEIEMNIIVSVYNRAIRSAPDADLDYLIESRNGVKTRFANALKTR